MALPSQAFVQALADRYRIGRELGEGGMATVYLATDLRHDRQVALKVLKPELAAVVGADRFLAEIRTTANLQHPHILPLFDSGEAAGLLFYVMPYVEGESLRERLDREKQLPVSEAVGIAESVATALDYAHRQGVVHRDIKPANILLQDGQPVLADFGIALAVSTAGGGRLTETGLSLGTPFYMSPEQATADRDPSPQSDIYALACVLYEMLAGSPPFSAATAQAVVMQIITQDPKPVRELRKSVPAHVERALDGALEKLPADRFSSAEDFARALRDPAVTAGRAAAFAGAGPVVGRRARVFWPALSAVLLVVAAWALVSRRAAPERPVVRFQLVDSMSNLGANLAGRSVAVSPDGRRVAHMTDGAGGLYSVAVRDLDQLGSRSFGEGNGLTTIAFSPDGELLAFDAGIQLQVVDLGNASRPQAVLEEPGLELDGFEWGPDGRIYYRAGVDTESGREQEIRAVDPETGVVERLLTVPADGAPLASAPRLLPGGRLGLVQLSALRFRFGLVDMETGERTVLADGRGPRFLSPDILVWQSDDRILAQRLDLEGRTLVGRPLVVAEGLPDDILDTSFDLAASGTLVYRTGNQEESNVVLMTLEGARSEIDLFAGSRLGIRMSPDGTRMAFEEMEAGIRDIWVMDMASGTRTRLTFEQDAASPTFRPDGERVAYLKIRRDGDGERGTAIFQKNADGSGGESILFDGPRDDVEVVFVPGTRDLLIREGDQTLRANSDLVLYRDGDPEQPFPIAATSAQEVSPAVSPDGRYVAYTEGVAPDTRVIVRSLSNPEERWQVSPGQGNEAWWHPDGSTLYFRAAAEFYAVPVSLANGFRTLGEPERIFETRNLLRNNNHTSYAWSSAEDAFVFLTNSDLEGTYVVLNWDQEIRRMLGSTAR